MRFPQKRSFAIAMGVAAAVPFIAAMPHATAADAPKKLPPSKVEPLGTTNSELFSDPRLNNAYELLSINGSFEKGKNPKKGKNLKTGAKDVDGWSVKAPVSYVAEGWKSADGDRSVGLAATGGSISRTVGTVKGHRYRVVFDASGDISTSPRTKSVTVSAGDTTKEYALSATGAGVSNMKWSLQVFDFVATSTTTTVTFSGGAGGSTAAVSPGVAIDNVRMRSLGPANPSTWSKDAVAVLMMDATTGGPEYWALKTMGAPVVLASRLPEALEYKVVVLSGTLTTGKFSKAEIALLEKHLAAGGVVVGEAITDLNITDLFGIAKLSESRTRKRVDFSPGDPTLADLNQDSERRVSLGDHVPGGLPGTVGYAPAPGVSTLASFDDGSAALLAKDYPSGGRAYALGARVLDLVTRQHQGARFPTGAEYVNTFATRADSWLLWLRGVYRASVGGGVTLSTAPDAKQYAVVPTLSLNFSQAVPAVEDYVHGARAAKATSTVFVPTRRSDDWLDTGYFAEPATTQALSKVRALGAEIASHGVVHSPTFHKLTTGTGREDYRTYTPRILSRSETSGATLLGELRVSRQLLTAASGSNTSSFRAGFLLSRRDLAGALDGTGYAYDSSVTQGTVGGAFPLAVPRFDGRGYSDVQTFPIVVEDEKAPSIDKRLASAQKVIAQNGENGAPSVLLFHPNPDKKKLKTWSTLLKTLPNNAWRGSLNRYGDFWSQRMRSEISTATSTVCMGGRRVTVRAVNSGIDLRDQSLDVADTSLQSVSIVDGKKLKINDDRKVELPTIPGGSTLTMDVCP